MAKPTSRARIEKERAGSYAAAGAEFLRSAEALRGREEWTSAAVLFVHSAIAWADAVSIARMGMKSTSENHFDAAALLSEAARGVKGLETAVRHLKHLLDQKNQAAYSGQVLRASDVEKLDLHANRFQAWAESILRS